MLKKKKTAVYLGGDVFVRNKQRKVYRPRLRIKISYRIIPVHGSEKKK